MCEAEEEAADPGELRGSSADVKEVVNLMNQIQTLEGKGCVRKGKEFVTMASWLRAGVWDT